MDNGQRSLNLAIDGRPLVGNRTGIGVHTAEIAGRLPIAPPPLIASHAKIVDRTSIARCRFAVDATPLGVWWQQTRFPEIVERERCDVVWGPHGTLPLSLRVPAVVSMHDLTSFTLPWQHRLKTVLSFNLFIRASLRRARAIAAVSRATADEVIRFGADPTKVHVVPNGVDDFFTPSPTAAARDFILYVGTIEPRKGVEDLLDAWEALPKPKLPLVLCGDFGWKNRDTMERVERLRSDGVKMTGYVDRERLRDLYRNARFFVYPSHHEGFGLPPLEAMACGTPVIAARGGAIPEILGEAAWLVPPGDREWLRRAMEALSRDDRRRAELTEKGLGRAAGFRWDRSAGLMLELFVRAAEGSS